MKRKEMIKKLQEMETIVLNSKDLERVLPETKDYIDNMFKGFEQNETNTCTNEWEKGYLTEIVFEEDCMNYTAGITMQSIANQPFWAADVYEDIDTESLKKLLALKIKELIGKTITLGELSGKLLELGNFEDIFDFDIDRDILDEAERGSFADITGDTILYFDILQKSSNPLDTIVKVTSISGI